MTVPADTRASIVTELRIPSSPEARVLHQVRSLGRTDRRTLQDSLQVSQPSITRHVGSLIDAGLIEEATAAPDDRVGRPRKLLQVDGRRMCAWGLHVGIRSSELVVVDAAGRLLRRDTVVVNVRDHPPGETIAMLVSRLRHLGSGLPEPVSVGAGFSAFVDADGVITSPDYSWEEVDAFALLETSLGRPVAVNTGVAAMAASDLAHTRLEESTETSTLYFYARDILAHAWVFNGRVHRPHLGRNPDFLLRSAPAELQDAAAYGQHPLSVAALISACRRRGHRVSQLPQVAALAEHDAAVGALLRERARALADVVTVALDVVDPHSVILAGDTFTRDRLTTTTVNGLLRDLPRGVDREVRVQNPRQQSVVTAAVFLAVQPIWADPLGAVG